MRHYLLIPFVILCLSSVLPSAEKSEPQTIEAQIDNLNSQIIPPKGTAKLDIDAVYGEAKEIAEPKAKGSATDFPMHIYQLLPSEEGQDFRAYLYITYREGKVASAAINHRCVVKGRPVYEEGSDQDTQQKKELEQEKLLVLKDLNDIIDRFADKLKSASWHHKTS